MLFSSLGVLHFLLAAPLVKVASFLLGGGRFKPYGYNPKGWKKMSLGSKTKETKNKERGRGWGGTTGGGRKRKGDGWRRQNP